MRNSKLGAAAAMLYGAAIASGSESKFSDSYRDVPKLTYKSEGSASSRKAALTKSQLKNRKKAKAGRKASKQRRKC